jgi:formylglycine-generating enzyme required for sulfatase activity
MCPLVRLALAASLAAAPGLRSEPATFQDCAECPRMIELPGGPAVIGSPAHEPERHGSEVLRHTEHIDAFAMSETEITLAQFAAFVADTQRRIPEGCYTHGDGMDSTSDLDAVASWRAPRFEQTDDHPVVCVTWQDATDYAAWLSRRTGQSYRLPSDAEWEYAARAGTTSAYFWGDDADRGCAWMNGGDPSLARALPPWTQTVARDRASGWLGARTLECDDGSAFTSAVRSYRPNAFGLYDVAGNVWEWVDACRDVPAADAKQTETADDRCALRGVRGGSWDDWPMDLRSADRHKTVWDTRRNDVGFRVARSQARAPARDAPADEALERPGS